jgi:hypothetical protein
MARYWYKIEVSRAVTIEGRKRVKSELMRLFQTTEIPSGEGLTFEVTTPLGPLAAEAALGQFAVKHGEAIIKGGGKLD